MMDSSPRTAPESLGGSLFDDRANQNEFFQHREAEVAYGTNPEDQLPSPIVPESPSVTQASAHHPENLVCMADKRWFVIREDNGNEWARFKPAEVTRTAAGTYTVPAKLARTRHSASLGALKRFFFWLGFFIEKIFLMGDGTVLAVQPIRQACSHYCRQKTDLNASKDVRVLARVCMAQHSETGEYISLMDSAVYACELRTPRDRESEKQLDEWDDKLIAAEELRRNEKRFDVDAELKKESSHGQ
jgi:hypothetical protein